MDKEAWPETKEAWPETKEAWPETKRSLSSLDAECRGVPAVCDGECSEKEEEEREVASLCRSSTLLWSSALKNSSSFRVWWTGTWNTGEPQTGQRSTDGSEESHRRYLRPHARVPAGVVTGPQLQVSGGDQRTQDVVLVVHEEGDHSDTVALCTSCSARSCSLLYRKVPNRQLYSASLSSLSSTSDLWVRYLSGHLPDAVDELDEERRALRVGVVLVSVTDALQRQEAQV
ncbi:hypothetical protein EYF80_016232 [Liparis tanakae]|uniref:Uncharacterized protein n=1 Tax=Liparis tanakae TaxID=230148 RepID=A0A4Z2I6G4_9TELE|nr:hypothetical protein EYF80_016232 [Liparis tanakae]